MPKYTPRLRRPPVLAAAVLIALAAPLASVALAQSSSGAKKNEPLVAPIAQTRGSGDAQVLIQLTAMVLGFAILAINFLPSKRGHQD